MDIQIVLMEVPDVGNAAIAALQDVVQLGDAPDIGRDPSARRQGLLAQVTRLLRAILVRHHDGKVDTCAVASRRSDLPCFASSS